MRHGLTWEYFTYNGIDHKRRTIIEINGRETIEWYKYVEIVYARDDLGIIKEWKHLSYDEKIKLEQIHQEFIFNEDRIKKLNRIIGS